MYCSVSLILPITQLLDICSMDKLLVKIVRSFIEWINKHLNIYIHPKIHFDVIL